MDIVTMGHLRCLVPSRVCKTETRQAKWPFLKNITQNVFLPYSHSFVCLLSRKFVCLLSIYL